MLRDKSPCRDRRSKKKPFCQNPLCGKGPGTEKHRALGGFLGPRSSGVSSFCSVFPVFFRPGAPGGKPQKTENGGKNTKTGAQKPAQIPMVLCLSSFSEKRVFFAKVPFFDRGPREGRGGRFFLSTPAGPLGTIFRGPLLLRLLRLLGF